MIWKKSNQIASRLFLGALGLTLSVHLYAQEPTTVPTPSATEAVTAIVTETPKPAGSKLAIGLGAGTNAIAGIDIAYKTASRFGIRLGYNYLDYKLSNVAEMVKLNFIQGLEEDVQMDVEIAQSSIQLIGDMGLTKRGRIRLSVGAAYGLKNYYSGQISYKKTTTVNDFSVTPEDIGYVKGVIGSRSKISPYLGLGLGNTVPRKRIGLSIDLGTYYKGSPTVEVEATNLLQGNTANGPILENNLKQYKWYPVASMRLAIRLN